MALAVSAGGASGGRRVGCGHYETWLQNLHGLGLVLPMRITTPPPPRSCPSQRMLAWAELVPLTLLLWFTVLSSVTPPDRARPPQCLHRKFHQHVALSLPVELQVATAATPPPPGARAIYNYDKYLLTWEELTQRGAGGRSDGENTEENPGKAGASGRRTLGNSSSGLTNLPLMGGRFMGAIDVWRSEHLIRGASKRSHQKV